MTTVFDPRATMSVKGAHSLSHDPSRWDEPLAQSGWNSIVSLAKARHEVAATVSAIVGDGRRVELHHNTEGGWMVDVSNTATIVFHWSSVTVDEYGSQRPVTRGEALVSIVHECMHLLHTDEVGFPPWIQDRAHCEAFHTMLNFAEDVRIEDLGEDSVPAFANIRLTENDRMVSPNVRLWAQHDLVRKVCLPLFAERSCTSGSSLFSAVLASDFDVATIVNASRSSFLDATYASSTAEVAERLRPMYEAIAPYLPTSNGGHGGKGGDEGKGGEPGEGTGGDEASETGGNSTNGHGDPDPDADDTDSEDGAGDGDDTGDETDTDADGSDTDDPTDGSDGKQRGTISDPTWSGEKFVPNSPRGDWENLIPREEPPDSSASYYDVDEVMEGKPVSYIDDGEATLIRMESETALTKVRVVKVLRRVLQDNANGGWSTRKKAGTFDPRQSTRLALGDMRTFRKKRGARGSLDYSLVLCLDASGSVSGFVGESIARSGLSVYEAASKIPGLDVAMCAYGSGLHVALPFDSTLRDVHRDGSRNRERVSSLLDCCARGVGGSTAEDFGLTWAIATSRRRNAESQMIVVMTDGAPNDRFLMPRIIDGARATGIRTGGIGVMHDAPDYHEYATRIDNIEDLPTVLGDLITTMMKGGK